MSARSALTVLKPKDGNAGPGFDPRNQARSCCVLDREAVATSLQSRGARRLTQRTAGNRI